MQRIAHGDHKHVNGEKIEQVERHCRSSRKSVPQRWQRGYKRHASDNCNFLAGQSSQRQLRESNLLGGRARKRVAIQLSGTPTSGRSAFCTAVPRESRR